MTEVIGDIGMAPLGLGVGCVGVRHGLIVHGMEDINGRERVPALRDDGVGGHGFVQFSHLVGGLVHGFFREQLMGDLGADECVDLSGRVALAVDPFVHLVA